MTYPVVRAWRRLWRCRLHEKIDHPKLGTPCPFCLRHRWHPGECEGFVDGPEDWELPPGCTWTPRVKWVTDWTIAKDGSMYRTYPFSDHYYLSLHTEKPVRGEDDLHEVDDGSYARIPFSEI